MEHETVVNNTKKININEVETVINTISNTFQLKYTIKYSHNAASNTSTFVVTFIHGDMNQNHNHLTVTFIIIDNIVQTIMCCNPTNNSYEFTNLDNETHPYHLTSLIIKHIYKMWQLLFMDCLRHSFTKQDVIIYENCTKNNMFTMLELFLHVVFTNIATIEYKCKLQK